MTLRVSQHDPHPLGLRREWEVGQDLILLHDPRRVLYHYLLLVSLHQLHTQRVRELHQRHLVWRAGLEVTQGLVVRVRVGRGHIVTESETSD